MLARLGHYLLILALLGATGGHWTLLQSVAWTTMVVEHARTAPLTVALAKTFDGKHPCQLCKKIEKGRETEQRPDLPPLTVKLEFFYVSARPLLYPPQVLPRPHTAHAAEGARVESPPVPPPRWSPV